MIALARGSAPPGASSFVRANRRTRAILGFSRHVVPPPPDWPEDAAFTGFWFLDEGGADTAAPELRVFLKAGPPPVYIGFGSMSSRDPRATLRLVLAAVAALEALAR